MIAVRILTDGEVERYMRVIAAHNDGERCPECGFRAPEHCTRRYIALGVLDRARRI